MSKNKKQIIITKWKDREERIGDFIFRPPVENHHIDDEFLLDAGKYFIHLERMSTQGIWIGISDNFDAHRVIHLNFYIGETMVRNEEGEMAYPLLLSVENEELGS